MAQQVLANVIDSATVTEDNSTPKWWLTLNPAGKMRKTMISAFLAGLSAYGQGVPTNIAVGPSGMQISHGIFVNVLDYGVQGGNVLTDIPKINEAIEDMRAAGGGRVYVPAGAYMVTASAALQMNNRVTLFGPAREGGAVFSRNGHHPMVTSYGVSILDDPTGAGHIRRWKLEDLSFEGAFAGTVYAAPILDIRASSICEINNVRFSQSLQQLVKAYEFFDSRIYNCRFTHADDTTSTYYAVEMMSGSDGLDTYEFTNQIHFENCVWEENVGRSLRCANFITNEIWFSKCKVENLTCNESMQWSFQSGSNILFDQVQFTSKGTPGHTITEILSIVSVSSVKGYCTWEHQGSVAVHAEVDPVQSSATPTAASIIRFASLNECRPCDLSVFLSGYTCDKLQSTYVIHRSGNILQSDVFACGWSNTMFKGPTNDGAPEFTRAKIHIEGFTTLMGIRFRSRIPTINNTQYFEIGRINGDGSGNQRFRFIHFNDTDSMSVWEVSYERDFIMTAGQRSSTIKLDATGTDKATGAPIPAYKTRVFVSVATTAVADSVVLPIGPPGKEIEVFNLTSQIVRVWPQTGIAMEGVADASHDIVGRGSVRFVMGDTGATGWWLAS